MPETVAVPTVTPPVVQEVGAVACGPKTVIVIVPVSVYPDASTELIELLAIAVPTASVAGPAAVTEGEALATTVSDIPGPQMLEAAALLVSPPYEAYHQ